MLPIKDPHAIEVSWASLTQDIQVKVLCYIPSKDLADFALLSKRAFQLTEKTWQQHNKRNFNGLSWPENDTIHRDGKEIPNPYRERWNFYYWKAFEDYLNYKITETDNA